jgi:hypothetical protein
MRKKFAAAVLASLASLLAISLLGGLLGCSGDKDVASLSDPDADIVEIQTFEMSSNEVAVTNYQVIFRQTSAEWDALSSADRETLVIAGFNAALAKVGEDGSDSYNILGQTSPDEEGASAQMAFIYNREANTLKYYVGAEAAGEIPAPELQPTDGADTGAATGDGADTGAGDAASQETSQG